MRVVVEFTGVSRILTRQSSVDLELAPNDTLQQVVISLAKKYPALIGEIFEKDGQSLIPTNVFSLNGVKTIHEDELSFRPHDGDKLILLSLLAGG
ncbi:MAG: sulfur-carrier protein [Chloroflexota bacterium]|nr:sulfur-carrier protein [Chloroflexota bacterium]